MKKIAVIGSGIAGNSAAWALSKTNDVTLFEKRERTGGHSNTDTVDYDGRPIQVDTGFIVYNDHNYPLLTKLFDHLNVETVLSNMSFGVSLDDGNFEWSGQGLKSVFAQRRNLFSPGFLFMLKEIFAFNRICKEDLKSGALCGSSFEEYLKTRKFSKRLKEDYLVPMTAAIWSTPPKRMLEFPAESLVRFLDNHRLIHKKAERPKWRTVKNGSRQYVDKLLADFKGEIRLNANVTSVGKVGDKVRVELSSGSAELFDEVVMASHSDQSLKMLSREQEAQRKILSAIEYKPNKVYLHRDERLMPKRRAAWSAWNYMGARNTDGERDLCVTYWMNRLQNIDNAFPIFVSLNPIVPPADDLTFDVYDYNHPQFDEASIEAQADLATIQGLDGIWFCGAWTKYGFHEDGLASGLDVARRIGAIIPFEIESERAAEMIGEPVRRLQPAQ